MVASQETFIWLEETALQLIPVGTGGGAECSVTFKYMLVSPITAKDADGTKIVKRSIANVVFFNSFLIYSAMALVVIVAW